MLTMQFGQCGNQLGHVLFSKICSDIECINTGLPRNINYLYSEDSFNKWFNGISKDGKRLARAIMIDTEQKVINRICNDTKMPWTYCTKNIISQAGGGCGNNWANGYLIKGHEICDLVLNAVRQEIERIDHFDGFLMLLSSAGGTGSGIGSYITQLLHEEYNTKCMITTTILPFPFGEVCTQNYNTLLTLAKLYNQTDMAVIFENEQIYSMCTNLLKNSHTSLQDINEIISEKLMAVLQPTNNPNCNLNSLISKVVSHPSYKLATIKSTPHVSTISSNYEPKYNWNSYVNHLKEIFRIPNASSDLIDNETKMPSVLMKNTTHHVYTCSVANVLITRGATKESDFVITNELEGKNLYADWVTTDTFFHLHQNRKIFNRDKFLALLTNNSQITRPLNTLLNKTWNSYTHSAYLHQYKQFGLEEDDFLQAFATIENTIKEYKDLIPHTSK